MRAKDHALVWATVADEIDAIGPTLHQSGDTHMYKIMNGFQLFAEAVARNYADIAKEQEEQDG